MINSDNKMCYKATCYATTAHLSKMLDLSGDKFTTTFQSRLGRDPWLEPYTDQTVEQLAKKGVKKMLVFSPAFVADCLETILEISEENQEILILDLFLSLRGAVQGSRRERSNSEQKRISSSLLIYSIKKLLNH